MFKNIIILLLLLLNNKLIITVDDLPCKLLNSYINLLCIVIIHVILILLK